MAFEAIIGSEPAAIDSMPRELTWQSSPGFENFARAPDQSESMTAGQGCVGPSNTSTCLTMAISGLFEVNPRIMI